MDLAALKLLDKGIKIQALVAANQTASTFCIQSEVGKFGGYSAYTTQDHLVSSGTC
jgi:hypothetical protein